MTGTTQIGLVIAVCTCRLSDLSARWQYNLAQLGGDEFLVVLDCPETSEATAITEQIRARGGTVLVQTPSRGLSAARNRILDARPDQRILFIDDDVLVNRESLDAIRLAFTTGAEIVGVRLVPPDRPMRRPWYFTPGQMHLVGWHMPGAEIKTWGACMGIDAGFAHRHGLRFDTGLGRIGTRLRSGEDTSFVAAMKQAGARERLLPYVHVVHDVDQRRLTLGYLARRAYWQGRSEMRRKQPLSGIRKEWRRYRHAGRTRLLSVGYLFAFAAGISHELVVATRRARW